MRIEGSLAKWNEDRGFGFVAPDSGGPEVFVHISALPRGMKRPSLGERLSFEIELTADGKKRARSVQQIAHRSAHPRPTRRPADGARPGRFAGALLLLALIGVGAYAYRSRIQDVPPSEPLAKAPIVQAPAREGDASFQCDGRTLCSQMRSCAEARYFLQHCPGTQMDGDHDGVPCEQQWCSGPLD